MNNKSENNEQLGRILNILAERMGTTPDDLVKAAQDGTLREILNGSSDDIKAFEVILSDPNIARKLLSPEQATSLIAFFENEQKSIQ